MKTGSGKERKSLVTNKNESMREIKFRGKRIDNGEWIIGDLCRGENGTFAISTNTIGLYEVHPESVGQYTGLKDKAGKEIYEGDILKDIHGYITEVRYIGAEFKSYCEPIDSGVGLFETEKYEIIGNVFENPDLLQSPNSQSK